MIIYSMWQQFFKLPFNIWCLQQLCHQLVIKSNIIFILHQEQAFFTNNKSPKKVPELADPSFPISLGYWSDTLTGCIDCLCKFCMAIISKAMDAVTRKTACIIGSDEFLNRWIFYLEIMISFKIGKWINIALVSQSKDFNISL